MTRTFVLCLVAMTAGLTTSAWTDDTPQHCAARSTIISLAHKVLDGREGLKGLQWRRARNFGVSAAYLLLRYGDLDDVAATALLNRITAEELSTSQDLKQVFLIANGTLEFDDIEAERIFDLSSSARWYPLILKDDGQRFFEEARGVMERTRQLPLSPVEDAIAYHISRILSDAPDETRAKVAATAERMGEIASALTLLADQRDLSSFRALAARHPDHRLLREVRRYPESFGVSLRHQSVPIDLGRSEGAFRDEWRMRLFEIRRADYRFGGFGFLNSFLNVTGKEHFVSDAATRVNDLIDSGWLDPVKRPEQAWISLYRQLIERMGQQAVDDGLRFARKTHRSASDQLVRDTIHNAIATQALTDFVLGKVDALPKRPKLLPVSTQIDWTAWTRVAGILHEGEAETLDDEADALIGIDLAFSPSPQEQYETAINVTERTLFRPNSAI